MAAWWCWIKAAALATKRGQQCAAVIEQALDFLQTAEKRMLSTKCCLCMRAHNHVHRLSMPVVGECCHQTPQCCHNTVHHTNCSIHSTVLPQQKWHSRRHSLSFFKITFMFYLIENAAEVTDCCLFVAADVFCWAAKNVWTPMSL